MYCLIVDIKVVHEILIREAGSGFGRHAHAVEFGEHGFGFDVEINAVLSSHLAQIATDIRHSELSHEVLHFRMNLLSGCYRKDRWVNILKKRHLLIARWYRCDILDTSVTRCGGLGTAIDSNGIIIVNVEVISGNKISIEMELKNNRYHG